MVWGDIMTSFWPMCVIISAITRFIPIFKLEYFWNAKTYTGEILIWCHIDYVLPEKPQNTHNLNCLFFNGCLGWKIQKLLEWLYFYRFACNKVLYLHFFCVFPMFISGKIHTNNLLYARRILIIFLMYLFRWRKGCGGSLMHVYVWEHIAFLTEPIDGCWPNLVGMK